MERRSRALPAGVLLFLMTGSAFVASQESKSSAESTDPQSRIEVQVVDPSGAVIPNAGITIQNGEGYVLHAETDASGLFSVRPVNIGDYTVVVDCRGFLRKGTTVSVHSNVARISLQLELGPAMIPDGPVGGTVVNVEPVASNTTSEILSPDLDLPLGGGPTELRLQNPTSLKRRPNPARRVFSAIGHKLGFK